MSKANLQYSPISGRIYWGRTNNDGVAIGEQRDVTSAFLQVMAMKFPMNTTRNVSVNGENKYRVLVIDMDKQVTINGKAVDFEPSKSGETEE